MGFVEALSFDWSFDRAKLGNPLALVRSHFPHTFIFHELAEGVLALIVCNLVVLRDLNEILKTILDVSKFIEYFLNRRIVVIRLLSQELFETLAEFAHFCFGPIVQLLLQLLIPSIRLVVRCDGRVKLV